MATTTMDYDQGPAQFLIRVWRVRGNGHRSYGLKRIGASRRQVSERGSAVSTPSCKESFVMSIMNVSAVSPFAKVSSPCAVSKSVPSVAVPLPVA